VRLPGRQKNSQREHDKQRSDALAAQCFSHRCLSCVSAAAGQRASALLPVWGYAA